MNQTLNGMWGSSDLSVARFADALECTKQAAEELVGLIVPSGNVTAAQRVALAVASALHRQAEIELPVAVAIVRGRRKMCEAVLSTLDFVPPIRGDEQITECDPFMFFSPHAGAAAAVPAIDHYIDVIDGRRIGWRRPRRDPYRLACELYRLSNAVKHYNTPALQEQYLELLVGLRGAVAQDMEWVGTIREGTFKLAPERFAEPSPTMRQGPTTEVDPTWFANVFGTRVSINISLAARCFKRRMMGLQVEDPFAPRSPDLSKTKQSRVPR